MPLMTTKGKASALKALAERRKKNKTRVRTPNSAGRAGDPMHFDCLTCGGDIMVPENYISRPKLCDECQALQDLGWLK